MHHERYAVSNHRRLAAPMRCYRIGDPSGAYPVYGAEGARRVGGRWHDRGDAVIYASRQYSTAMLERLVHWGGQLPPNQHLVEITITAGTSHEGFTAEQIGRAAGWEWGGREGVIQEDAHGLK